jgi:tRNA(Ile)-lysidine synthase
MPNNLEVRVRKTIREYRMLAGGEHVLVAVSGGADSTALLLCLHELVPDFHLTLTVAHLNHRIRGSEGDADEDFVRKLSASLGLSYISETIDVKQLAIVEKQNLEELARRVRYDFLIRAAHKVGAQKIAVGHNLNDQAETALFRFIRGSGVEGLSSIHPVVAGGIIRPLLDCPRDSILHYLKRMGAQYREDSTNTDLRHARNRIRQELLPYLETHFNPQLIATLAREARLARETWSFMESQAKKSFQEIQLRADDALSIPVEGLLKMHPALQKQVLRQAVKECLTSLRGITAAHIETVLSLCTKQSGAAVQLPQGSIAMRQFDDIVFLRHPLPPAPAFSYQLNIPGRCLVPEIGAEFVSEICGAPDLQTMTESRWRQPFLNRSALPAILTIRSRMPGDRYGGEGHRKVKKMLIGSRIPRTQRSVLPMIVAGTDVIWIPGFRPARAYEALPGSQGCVVIIMKKSEAGSQEPG